MADIKLSKLPDRAPVKLTINVTPELKRGLDDYARAYEVAYGSAETVADLVPYMLQAFLDADRGFARSRSRT